MVCEAGDDAHLWYFIASQNSDGDVTGSQRNCAVKHRISVVQDGDAPRCRGAKACERSSRRHEHDGVGS